MNFKRGIFCGLIIMVGSVSNIHEMYSSKNIAGCVIFALTLLMGVIQLIVSFGYENPMKKRTLLLCFGIEGIYCAVSLIYLILSNAGWDIKIFGIIVAVIYSALILTSIYTLYSNIVCSKRK